MNNNKLKYTVIIGLIFLVVAIALQFLPRTSTYYFKAEKPLAEYFPKTATGWGAEDVPLGANESLISKVNAILQFDDYVYRRYTREGVEFSVYVAYWRPHTQSDSVVGSHNPDVCWVQNGWKMTEQPSPFYLIHDGVRGLRGESRIFQIQGERRYVAFWHVKGGVLTGAAVGKQTNLLHRAPYVWKNLVHSGFGMREYEMIFVRLDANVPLEELAGDPLFASVSDVLYKMGIGGMVD